MDDAEDSGHGFDLAVAQRDAERSREALSSAAFREALDGGKSETVQVGFDIGYAVGAQAGLLKGVMYGVARLLEVFGGDPGVRDALVVDATAATALALPVVADMRARRMLEEHDEYDDSDAYQATAVEELADECVPALVEAVTAAQQTIQRGGGGGGGGGSGGGGGAGTRTSTGATVAATATAVSAGAPASSAW